LKCLKNKGFLSLILLIGLIYGCGGGGGSTGGGGGACNYIPLTGNKFKISIKENGIYVITPGILKSFCIDSAGTSLSNFKLQNFDPNTSIMIDIPVNMDQGNMEFYGVGVNRNDYTETNIYWLSPVTPSNPQSLMGTKDSTTGTPISAMTTLHQEINQEYWPSMLQGAGLDHWFWDRISAGMSPIYQFNIYNYDNPLSDPSKLSVSLQAQFASTHTVMLLLTTLSSVPFTLPWSTTTPYIYTVPVTDISNGNLSMLQLTNNGVAGDDVYFNWFEIEYPGKAYNDQLVFHGNIPNAGPYTFNVNGFTQNNIELLDITDPKNPLKFTNPGITNPGNGFQLSFGDNLSVNNNYIALTPAQRKKPLNIVPVSTKTLTSLTGGFDYLIITHGNFLSNIQPLVTYRNSPSGGGHTVQVVTIDDVYDSFSGGIFTPQAIKDFLSMIYPNMTSPGYVLLVGDASFDYKNYYGHDGEENFVPTYLMEYSRAITDGQTHGQTPSDYWFVPQQGFPYPYPLMAIGRLPGKTGAEVDTMVNKIINYKKPSTPSWNQKALFVTASDGTSTFDTNSDNLIANLPTGYNPIMVYDSVTTPFTNEQITTSINNGALITNYFGHGSVGVWANGDRGNLRPPFFQSSDALNNLTDINMLTFLVTLDCLNGMFAGPSEGTNPISLSEAFLKSSKGGAVAAFSPTGEGFTTNHAVLAQSLYQIILPPIGLPPPPASSPMTIGWGIQQAEKSVLLTPSTASPQMLETVSIFVLLGDPATQLAVP
jgi:hypothetical protein